MHKLNRINEKGIGLVEMVIALGVAIIVITAMVSLSVYTLRSSTQGEIMFEASKYANEYLERVRLTRDSSTSWSSFITTIQNCDTSNCYYNSSGNVTTGQEAISGTSPQVTRYFRVTNVSGGTVALTDTVVRVSVTVTWSIGGNQRSTYVYTDLSNWRRK